MALLLALLTAGTSFSQPRATTYRVTITNLTTSGQALTPPVIATHRPATGLFTVGEPASFEIKEIAENGNLGPMLTALENNKHVSNVVLAVAGSPRRCCPVKALTWK